MTRLSPTVDIVIATHTLDRPVERAVASVLDSGEPAARAIVVCHEVPAAAIRDRLRGLDDARIMLLEHRDGHRSPAGPFNAGIHAATATYLGILGSDDTLSPGALPRWRGRLDAGGDVVLARVTYQSGQLMRTPPTRLGRRSERLDPVRDRLSYRTAPLGLFRRAMVAEHDLRFTDGLATGEDLEFGVRLWLSGRALHYAADDPPYIIGQDADVRVTMTSRPVADDLAACVRLVEQQWFRDLDATVRRAVVVKLLRIHVFGSIVNRATENGWTDAERASLASMARRIQAGEPDSVTAFSLAEYRLWTAICDPSEKTDELLAASVGRARHGRPATILTRRPQRLFDAQAPLRLMAASVLMR